MSYRQNSSIRIMIFFKKTSAIEIAGQVHAMHFYK